MNMTRRMLSRLLVVSVLAGLLIFAAALQGNSVAPATPGANDRCPVCGTLVQPYGDWLAQVRYADGTTLFFEGPKDLFRYLQSPERYAEDRSGVEIDAVFVTTWTEHRTIPLESAWFVIGSDVRGPAGEELVALRSIEEANRFIIENGGTRLVQADDVTATVIAQLP